MKTSVQLNQANSTPTSENTKSDWNAAQGMGSGLTPKQMSWICRWLLDAMWDVRSVSSIWGISSATSGWWVLIKSRLWLTCHKSRKIDTWWEVFEMILACDLQLLQVDPWIKGFLCMFPWEKQPMHANQFFSVPEGTGQLNWTCKRLLNCREKMHISGWELD